IPKLDRKQSEIHTASVPYFPLRAVLVGENTLLMAARYHPASPGMPPYMEEMDVVERNETLQPVLHIYAAEADWDNATRSWTLLDGRKITGLLPGKSAPVEEPILTFKADVTPETLMLYHSSASME